MKLRLFESKIGGVTVVTENGDHVPFCLPRVAFEVTNAFPLRTNGISGFTIDNDPLYAPVGEPFMEFEAPDEAL